LDLLGKVAKIRCPALLLTGGRNPITPLHPADAIVGRMAPLLGTARVLSIAGHHVFHEAPEESFPLVEEFITDVWADVVAASDHATPPAA